MVSIHTHVHSKVIVTYTLTRQTDPGFFLEIKFKGGIAFVGRENIKKTFKKQTKFVTVLGGKSKTSPPKGPEKNH